MMNTNLTELILILDRSGSMSGLESDTIGGYNSMIDKQRKEAGNALVTTVLFDNKIDVLHNRIEIENIPRMTEKEYVAGGTTALLDAVGSSIERVRSQHLDLRESAVPAHTIVVITTDGQENSSTKYSFRDVRQMITECQSEHGWEFLFLGADMDAIAAAADLGIRADRAASYCHDAIGTEMTFRSVSDAVSHARGLRAEPLSAAWKADLESDYQRRGRKAHRSHRG